MSITNAQSGTRVDEVAEGIYRINTPVTIPGGTGFSFNQYLIEDDEPLLFHTGPRRMFPLVLEAVGTILPAQRLRYVSFSHVESDECGSLNEWLAAAPHAAPLCGTVAAIVSIQDLADRPPRALADGESYFRWGRTPFAGSTRRISRTHGSAASWSRNIRRPCYVEISLPREERAFLPSPRGTFSVRAKHSGGKWITFRTATMRELNWKNSRRPNRRHSHACMAARGGVTAQSFFGNSAIRSAAKEPRGLWTWMHAIPAAVASVGGGISHDRPKNDLVHFTLKPHAK